MITPTDIRLGSLMHALIVVEVQPPLEYTNLLLASLQTYLTQSVEHVALVLPAGCG
jgi:hypothetical protein